jgi:hypothetical protein
MKEKHVKGLDIKVPETKAFTIETPENLMKAHFNLVVSGKRGSGKSVAIINLLKQLQDAGCLDRLFIISPTIYSNKHILDMVKYDPDDVYEEPSKDALESVIDAVEQEALDYEEYIEKLKVYKQYMQFMKTGRGKFDDSELFDLWDPESQMITKPVHKWDGKKPVMVLFCDDCQGSPIYNVRSKLSNYVIRHRHLGQLRKSYGALGLSMIFAVQSYKSAGGGLPRALRGQATQLIIFKSKDIHELDDIADECGGEVSKEVFMKVYEAATDEPHSFLFIDLHKKDNHPSMFRKKFSTFLIPEEMKADEEATKEKSK